VSAEEEAAQIKNQYIRLMADFDNYRKRQAREREEFVKRSNERLLGDILPVVDNLELALKKISDPEDPFAAGVKLVFDQFLSVLKRCGLTPIEAQGKEFNPEQHEALSYIPSPTVPANQVIDQFRCGWDLSGHLMRAAQVIVSSGKPNDTADQESISD
jgi:molecular chaperone GrpE